ncbi:DUF2750 domain-containing protein [Microbulbifer hainanensis]|uniref:DUF2750 domain-containing protein n=1 Tax=Microbulbifer hainanensis TaxID=2735675 RepID=UPI0018663B3B|nr:DUF2750 domain-containing protein [Microbulbifer hainanensis]
MDKQELAAVFDLSCEDRFEYFLDVVGEEREIWILIDDHDCFLKLHSEDDGGFEYLPVWPSTDFAAEYAGGETGLAPKSIALPQFLKKWLSGLERDGIEIGVFPGPDNSVWVTEPAELGRDLRDVLSSF